MSSDDTYHAAARRGDFAELRRLLVLDPGLLHSRDAGGRSVLHHLAALEPGQSGAAVQALTWLRSLDGLQVDALNEKTGLSPLHRAVLSDNRTFALALVEAGANALLTSPKERRSAVDLCRDTAFAQELLQASTLASAAATPPAASPTASTAPRRASLDSTQGASLASREQSAFSGAAAAPPAPQAAAAQPGGTEAREEALAEASPRASTQQVPLSRRRLALPSAAAAASLQAAWTRIAAALPSLQRTPALQRLAWRGVPPSLRPALYAAASGASAARSALGAFGLGYAHLCCCADALLPEATQQQIDKDVRRSGLSLQDATAQALRRLLRALAVLDPATGYCQAMNSVGALCLVLTAEEEAAFHLALCVLRHVYPPGYYGGVLAPARTDAAAVATAVLRLKPGLAAALGGADNATLLLSSLALPWLMCAFVGAVPLELTLRLWDLLALNGLEPLLQVAATLLLDAADAAAAAGRTLGEAAALDCLMGSVSRELAEVLSPDMVDDLLERARLLPWLPEPAAQDVDTHGSAGGELKRAVAGARGAVRGAQERIQAAGGAKAVAGNALRGLASRIGRAAKSSTPSGSSNEPQSAQQSPEAPCPLALPPPAPPVAATRALSDVRIAHSVRASTALSSLRGSAAAAVGLEAALDDCECQLDPPLPEALFPQALSPQLAVAAALVGLRVGPPEATAAEAEAEDEVEAVLSEHARRQAAELLGEQADAGALRKLRALLDGTL